MAKITNKDHVKGTLAEVIKGADVFVGVSAPGTLTGDMVRSMAKDPIIFACANPTPEIFPDEAKAAGAAVVSTGRSDFPNQINNVLCFPGIFRGALDVRASQITENMKIAAAYAIAGLVSDDELNAEHILPKAFDPRCRSREEGRRGADLTHVISQGNINFTSKEKRLSVLIPTGVLISLKI